MLRTKISTTVITLVAALSFAGASLAPTAAQAQWHTYCTAGHCITHTNFTIGGVSPCTAIDANYSKAYDGLLEALQLTPPGTLEEEAPGAGGDPEVVIG